MSINPVALYLKLEKRSAAPHRKLGGYRTLLAEEKRGKMKEPGHTRGGAFELENPGLSRESSHAGARACRRVCYTYRSGAKYTRGAREEKGAASCRGALRESELALTRPAAATSAAAHAAADAADAPRALALIARAIKPRATHIYTRASALDLPASTEITTPASSATGSS